MHAADLISRHQLAQKDLKGTDSAFADLCSTLSNDGDTPWIRGKSLQTISTSLG